jgi:ribose-phosphate pyrophosphokinase
MKIISGTSNRPLGEAIAAHLNVSLVQATIQRFADREVFIEVQESVRGEDIFVIQPTSSPTNDTLMELLVTVDALKRGSAKSITAVIPYYGYGRQDRKTAPRSPISAKLVANLLTVAGTGRVLTIDWHSGQIQGFFDIPTDNLTLAPLFYRHIQGRYNEKPVVIVSPDVGGVVRARIVAEPLGADMAIIDKRRSNSGEALVMNLMGDVKGRACILIDDMADSAGTLCQAAEALSSAGATTVDAYVSHGVLSGDALKKIDESSLSRLIISDTIQPLPAVLNAPKIEILTVAPLLGEAIRRIAQDQSISSLLR